MKRWLPIFLLATTGLTAIRAGEPAPEISYHWDGGFSPFGTATVEVNAAGDAVVVVQRRGNEPVRYSTRLTPDEIAALAVAVRASCFFEVASDQDVSEVTDVGRTTLSVSYRNKRRTLRYRSLSGMIPLQSFLTKLVIQADLSDAANASGRFYELLGAIDPRLGASKILQPYLFKPKIVASLPIQTEFAAFAWRLQALSCLTTPEEFAGIVAQAFPAPDTREWIFWLTSLSTPECYNNLPKEHLQAMFPLFLEQIKMHGTPLPSRDLPKGEAFYRFKDLFWEYSYVPGLAVGRAP